MRTMVLDVLATKYTSSIFNIYSKAAKCEFNSSNIAVDLAKLQEDFREVMEGDCGEEVQVELLIHYRFNKQFKAMY